jgi:hypothetical protein
VLGNLARRRADHGLRSLERDAASMPRGNFELTVTRLIDASVETVRKIASRPAERRCPRPGMMEIVEQNCRAVGRYCFRDLLAQTGRSAFGQLRSLGDPPRNV